MVKNRYVGRTFILPNQKLRDLGVRRKLNPLKEIINGKSIIVVDDSIVRGTTTPFVVDLLRKAGAKKIHLYIMIWEMNFFLRGLIKHLHTHVEYLILQMKL